MIIKYHFGLDIYFLAEHNFNTKELTYYIKEIDREKHIIKFIQVKSSEILDYIEKVRRDLFGVFFGCEKTVITGQVESGKAKRKFFDVPGQYQEKKTVFTNINSK